MDRAEWRAEGTHHSSPPHIIHHITHHHNHNTSPHPITTPRSVKCFRSQLPKATPFYPCEDLAAAAPAAPTPFPDFLYEHVAKFGRLCEVCG
jgi:hypothetical protein